MKIIIKNGRIINPKTSLNEISDLLIVDGIIEKIGKNIVEENSEIIDGNGKIIVPGLVDLHVHFREPGFEDKETIETGAMAAVAGGVTTVACMPNTSPAIHSSDVVNLIKKKSKEAKKCKVEVVGAITMDIIGKEITPMEELISAGIIGVSDDGRTTSDEAIMKRAFEIIKKYNIPLMAHTEDVKLVEGGCMNRGEASYKLGLKGIPNAAESNIVNRDIQLCKETNSKLHICHVSTKESMDYIREAKKDGVNVTVEICPHHFILTDDIVKADDAYSKVNPPIRSKADVDNMLKCIVSGDIDIIVTDHAPHEDSTKKISYDKAAFGISGVETSFALSYTYLVKTGLITIDRLIELMSVKPAEIINKNIGDISIGNIADIAVINLDESYIIDSKKFYSKGKNTPFNGFEVSGVIDYTIVDGEIVFRRK